MIEKAKGSSEIQRHPDIIPSPEEIEQFHDTLDKFLLSLPKKIIDDGNGWCAVRCQADFTDGDHKVYVAARLIRHKDFGVVSRELVRIVRGTGSVGPDVGSDFVFTVYNTSGDQSLTIDIETGKVTSGVNEVMEFEDNAAIEVRQQQLLDDPTFCGNVSSGVVVPNLQMTPSGEIYEDGSLTLDEKQLGVLCVKTTFSHTNDDDRMVLERQSAAYDEAQKDIGTELTTERMVRLIGLLSRIQQQIQ